LDIEFDADIEEPKKFISFLKERFYEKDIEVIIDHLASVFVHTSVLGAKPKMLFIKGKTDTYKSLLIEILKFIITSNSITKVSNEQLSDKFGLDLIADAILNYSEEQNAIEPKDPASLKDAVTMESGFVTRKYSQKQAYASRFPKHIVMCNKIAPIAKDDDDDSIFNRNEYVEIKDLTDNTPNWRDEILNDKKELQKICMFLLRRASIIFNGEKIKQQTIKESKKRYIELTQGSFTKFIEDNYDIVEGFVGTQYEYMWNDFKRITKNNISKGAFDSLVEDGGYVKSRDRVYRVNNEPNVFTEISELTNESNDRVMVTVVKGLRPKLISRTSNPNAKPDEPPKSDGGLRPSM